MTPSTRDNSVHIPNRNGPVAGILLAAGASTRMGSNKLLFELGGQSVLRGAAQRAVVAGLAPVNVVLGHQAEPARQELDGLDCRVVLNRDYELGITASLTAGLAALAPEVSAVVVMLADMPLVTASMISELIARYRATTAPLVVSSYDGVHAPPILYDRGLFAELRSMTGDSGCGRQVVKRHRSEAEELRWPSAALADIDVPADYARMRLQD